MRERALDFLDFVHSHDRVLLDGAIGTELFKRGQTSSGPSNLGAPELVLEIHREYAQCGCHALVTNSLTMNRLSIETHGIPVDVEEVNRSGVDLARQAAGDDQFVLGNISSTGQLLEPYGTYEEADGEPEQHVDEQDAGGQQRRAVAGERGAERLEEAQRQPTGGPGGHPVDRASEEAVSRRGHRSGGTAW